ncbi:MAG: undecaprenyldiphospho-muramoylpentapeptide beta-N-acetylglucosaminyltransferase, partial [Candidatus Nanopelagicales bacterium]
RGRDGARHLMTLRVALAAGGTGGHIEPALNLADELRRRDPGTDIVVIGTAKGLETRLVPARGYELALIDPVPMPRRPGRDLVTLPGRLRRSVRQARDVMQTHGSQVVVGFGGYVSIPAYLGARRRVPSVVHEANAKPGLANRVGARLTPWVAENYAGTLPHAQRLGCPLRHTIETLDRAARRSEAREFFGLDAEGPVLLVFGGSQGAASLNAALAGARDGLLAAGIQILHAVGPRQVAEVTAAPGYRPLPFIDRMDLAYAAADLAVCRAGAMTCAEVAAIGLPCLYVPYAVGNGEQRFNAEPVVAAGGGIMVPDADLTPQRLLDEVVPLLADPQRLTVMGERAAEYGIADGAARLANMVSRAAEEGR